MKKLVVSIIVVFSLVAGIVLVSVTRPQALMTAVQEYIIPEDVSLSVAFSEVTHFFEDTIEVSIFASNPYAQIFFTRDGSFPTRDSLLYTQPVRVFRTRNTTVLRAIAYYSGEYSSIETHTFFMGRGAASRHNTYVFSITTNADYLFCHYEGILVEGFLREQWHLENPGQHPDPPEAANFNMRGREAERPIHLEVFNADGERVISQLAGIRAHGRWSRAYSPHTSLRLIARRYYEPGLGSFHYDFFPEDVVRDGLGTPLTRYDTLILRNGANDRRFGMLRNELGSILARNAGFDAVTPVRPAAIYVNGEYFGFAWLQVRMIDRYLQDIFDAPTRDFDVIGDGELWLNYDYHHYRYYDLPSPQAIRDLRHKNNFRHRDLTRDSIFYDFTQLVCIDNLLFYYAFQIFMGAEDWPHNNLRRWRYNGEWHEGMHPHLDGRWRYVFYDLDWTLGLYSDNYRKPTFRRVLVYDNARSPMLQAILRRPDMQHQFTMIMNDIAANIVTTETVTAGIEYLYSQAYHEIGRAFEAGMFDWWVSRYTVLYNHNNMIHFATYRAGYINHNMSVFFGVPLRFFTVEVDGSPAIIGTQPGTSTTYFSHLTIPVQPILERHEEFYHWEKNGQRIYQPTIYVSAADATNGTVSLTLHTREALPPVLITAVHMCADTNSNGISLINPHSYAIRIEGLFLTNDRHNPHRWAVPTATIPAYSSLRIVGDDSRAPTDLGAVRMNFNIRHNRHIILTDMYGTILDSFFYTGGQ